MTGPLVPAEVGDEELAAPDMAVRAVPGAVPGDADDAGVEAVVGEATRDVCMMMLDGDTLDTLERPRVRARAIPRMKVMSHDARRQIEQLLEVRHCVDPCSPSNGVGEIAEMLAEKRVAPAHQGKDALEFPTDRQDGSCRLVRKADRERHITACPTNQHRPACGHPRDRVVAAHLNRPIVHEEQIRHPTKPRYGLAIVVNNRLPVCVATSHDEGDTRGLEQEMMKRRIR